eukprot:COSAG02_NODE_539_length_20605_cov_93.802155_9_plen_90_part_00
MQRDEVDYPWTSEISALVIRKCIRGLETFILPVENLTFPIARSAIWRLIDFPLLLPIKINVSSRIAKVRFPWEMKPVPIKESNYELPML